MEELQKHDVQELRDRLKGDIEALKEGMMFLANKLELVSDMNKHALMREKYMYEAKIDALQILETVYIIERKINNIHSEYENDDVTEACPTGERRT